MAFCRVQPPATLTFTVLGTDIVYKTGVVEGMPATKVKHLFAPVANRPPVLVTEQPAGLRPVVELAPIDPPVVILAESKPPQSVVSVPESHQSKPFQEPSPRWRTASAGKGAIIVGQDGTQVKFKKQCTTCQHIDS